MRCLDCGEDKPEEEFPRHRNKPSGRHCYCKPCHNARGRETRQRLYGGSRHYHLKRKYGVGAADVDSMIEKQGGMCPICRKRSAVHVDHDHTSQKVRAILCEPCNGGLGQFKDNPEFIQMAIKYLQQGQG